MQALVSIIIPVFNLEKFLDRCIASVLEQTYPEIEIVLVDDGSTDTSPEICDGYAEKDRRVVVLHQENAGVSAARNAGIAACTGEYIMFVDGDDTIPRDAVKHLTHAISADNADMAIGQLLHVDLAGNEASEQAAPVHSPLTKLDFLTLALSDHPFCYYACRTLYRKTFLSGMVFCAGRVSGEDSFFVFQCALRQPRVSVISQPVYRYHANSSSATRTPFTDKKYEDIMYFLNCKAETIRSQYPDLEPLMNNLILKITMMLLSNLSQTHGKKWRLLERQALQTFFAYQSFFIPATSTNERWYSILSKHLYYPYKYSQPLVSRLIKLKHACLARHP